jgi:transposase-like protein
MIDGQRLAPVTDPEVTPKARRRSFTAAYKKKILAEMDAAAGSGNIGELLRREGIYSSTLTRWRRERDNAVDSAFSQKRGPVIGVNYFSRVASRQNVTQLVDVAGEAGREAPPWPGR